MRLIEGFFIHNGTLCQNKYVPKWIYKEEFAKMHSENINSNGVSYSIHFKDKPSVSYYTSFGHISNISDCMMAVGG